jgi:ABC-2 type transport system permease protein
MVRRAIMIPWILAMPLLQSPQSALAVALSLVPVFPPNTMFLRIVVSETFAWQIALSITPSVATIYILSLAAKILRVEILAGGKRPTIPELVKWLKFA